MSYKETSFYQTVLASWYDIQYDIIMILIVCTSSDSQEADSSIAIYLTASCIVLYNIIMYEDSAEVKTPL